MTKTTTLWLILVLLQVLDLLSTWIGLQHGATESNPVGVAALTHGFPGLVAMKAVAMLTALGIALYLIRRGQPQRARQGLGFSVAMMILVVSWNTAAIISHSNP